MKKSVLVTGAAGGLGSAFARGLAATESSFDLHLADRPEAQEALERVGKEVHAEKLLMIDLFGQNAGERNEINGSDADVIIWNAAVNVDHPEMPIDTRKVLRERQNAALERMLTELKIPREGEVARRLLVVVNSVTALFGQNPKIADFLEPFVAEQNLHYGLMKGEQAMLLQEQRGSLAAAGTDLSVLYPGSIDTGFTDVTHALTNANSLGKKMKNQRGRVDWKQAEAFKPTSIATAVSALVRKWSETGEVPDNRQEWIMLNEGDLTV